MVLRGQGGRPGVIEVSPGGDVLSCTGEVDRLVVAAFIDDQRCAGTWSPGLEALDVVDVRAATFLDSGAGELVRAVATARTARRGRLAVRGASPLFVLVLEVVGAARLVALTD